jgi:signal transduction histidine kinase
MLLIDALQFLAQALYVVLFGVTLGQALRHPSRATFEIALFFGTAAAVVALALLGAALRVSQAPLFTAVSASLLMALPYLLLRLAATFSELRVVYLRAAEVGLALCVVSLSVVPMPYPLWMLLGLVGYFVVVAVGASLSFVRQGGRASGVTRRRLQCVAWGSGLLGLDILVAGLGAIMPAFAEFWAVVGALFGLASGVLYFVGFAPPLWLRRTWQEPALRAFVARSAQLVREPDIVQAIRDLEERTAAALGAAATIGQWVEPEGVLRFYVRNPNLHPRDEAGATGYALHADLGVFDLDPGNMIAGRAFAQQRPIFTSDSARDDPAYAEYYRSTGALAAMAAPISAGARRFGVLTVYAARAPVFADSDLELVQLMADQAAIVLQSRALVEDATLSRARQEAARLKDEFLASISHDLRNPLTAVRGVTQVLERRIERDGKVEPDRLASALGNIRGATSQMASLIDQLLDYARMQGDRPLELTLSTIDLVELTRRTVGSFAASSERHQIQFEPAVERMVGEYDAARLERVVQNLVGNAVKYSPDGGVVVVRAMTERSEGKLWGVVSVEDHGMGIPNDDLALIFDRFHRAANAAGVPGSGLGLSASRQVVQQHGGSISVHSEVGRGSTFVVRLPLPCQSGAV